MCWPARTGGCSTCCSLSTASRSTPTTARRSARSRTWTPPASIRRDYSKLPRVIPGGSPQNPMGVAALTLSGGGEYAIHGTNQPNLIGGFVSHGCIRMYNADVTDLFGRVNVGTPVVVIR